MHANVVGASAGVINVGTQVAEDRHMVTLRSTNRHRCFVGVVQAHTHSHEFRLRNAHSEAESSYDGCKGGDGELHSVAGGCELHGIIGKLALCYARTCSTTARVTEKLPVVGAHLNSNTLCYTLYTNLPHTELKERIPKLVRESFQGLDKKYIIV